jgi:hydrogenase maturation protease
VKTLVAGFGNIFLGDDGFGPAVIRALDAAVLPRETRVRDFGTRGMHLALEMSSGYDTVILVDVISRDEPAGTLLAIDVELLDDTSAHFDPHAMNAGAVLALYQNLCAQSNITTHPRIVVAGCVPLRIEEGMELSEPVRAAIAPCASLVERLANRASPIGAQS